MSELIIRPGRNDHRVVENLLVAGGGVRALRPAISRLVLDAPLAAGRPQYVRAAEASGTPVLVDPLTFLLQSEVSTGDSWGQLPFGRPAAISAGELADPAIQRQLIERVIDFELAHGATALIPPYILVGNDPQWLQIALDLLTRTREHLDQRSLPLPLIPVLALSRPRRLGAVPWRSQLERLSVAAVDVGAERVALAISGTGGPNDGHDPVHLVLGAIRGLADKGIRTLAWRQGLLGPAAIATGAVGYECGIGLRERCDLAGLQAARRPGLAGPGFAPPSGVFVQPLGRSLKRKVARELLGDRQLRPRLVCDDDRCCPRGVDSTLADPRRHAILARAKALADLDRMPSRQWRLNAIARWADSGAVVADLSTRVLTGKGQKDRVSSTALGAIAIITDFIREEGDQVA